MMRAQVEHHEIRETRRARGLRTAGPRQRGWVRGAGFGLGALLLAAGCGPDAQGKFDEFVEKTKEGTGTGTGGTTSAPETTTEEPTSGSTSGGPMVFDISGDFLLAVSTTVDRGKPLQFIVTNTVVDMGGKMILSSCLQPLTLTQGKVTVPREPIGEPLCFEGNEIVDGAFTIDAGVVMVTGMANPITGGDIVASLVLAASIESSDLYCGTVSGMVMQPLETSIDGSSFAAVRLTDTAVLPNPIVIDCKGTTVTDK